MHRPRLAKKSFHNGLKLILKELVVIDMFKGKFFIFCLIIYYCGDCRSLNNKELLLLVWA